jgi:hypothetical protein
MYMLLFTKFKSNVNNLLVPFVLLDIRNTTSREIINNRIASKTKLYGFCRYDVTIYSIRMHFYSGSCLTSGKMLNAFLLWMVFNFQ